MRVTFTRSGERRYSVTVEGPGIDTAKMDPAPGFDERLPHDAAHFIVENELGIQGGVFGQLAAGGTANTFFSQETKSARKARKRGAEMAKANKHDAVLSEQAVFAAQSRWEQREIQPETNIPADRLAKIIEGFEEFASNWSKLPVGGSITLEWRYGTVAKRRR